MSQPKYKVGQEVPYRVKKDGKLKNSKGVIGSIDTDHVGIIIYKMNKKERNDYPGFVYGDVVFESEIDKGFKKYSKRKLSL